MSPNQLKGPEGHVGLLQRAVLKRFGPIDARAVPGAGRRRVNAPRWIPAKGAVDVVGAEVGPGAGADVVGDDGELVDVGAPCPGVVVVAPPEAAVVVVELDDSPSA